jgi:hypothetical protein
MRSVTEILTNDEKKWEKTGILTSAKNPKMISFCFNYCVKLLPESDISVHDGTILPVVYRIIDYLNISSKEKNKKIIKNILIDYPIFIKDNKNVFEDLSFIPGFDRELQMCKLFSENFILKYEKTI